MLNFLFLKIKKVIANVIVACIGWKIKGDVPKHVPKLIMLGVPHTSNWDFFLMMCCAWRYELNVKWLGKESLFSNKVFHFFSTMMGGIKVDRSTSEKAVQNIADAIKKSKHRLCLTIAPEGTRRKKSGWRSGFYYIAKQAQIPIGLGYIDYAKRCMGVGPILSDLQDLESTMDKIREFYKDIKGKYPKNQSPIQIITSD